MDHDSLPVTHISVEDIVSFFENLEDPRSTINRRHPLVSVVVISLMAVLGGANGPSGIAEWANLKKDFLMELLPLPNGIPQKDVYRRVLAVLDARAFQAAFTEWIAALQARVAAEAGIERPLYHVDGKTLRRSHDRAKGLGALHSVSVWAGEAGLTLAQVATDEKSNEITAIPELFTTHPRNCIRVRTPVEPWNPGLMRKVLKAGRPLGSHRHDRRDGDAKGHRQADC